LTEDLRRYQLLIVGNDSTGIDDAQTAAIPYGFTIEAVAGNSRLVTDNGPT